MCPEDGCGLDTCSSEEWADFPVSVDSFCELDGDYGECSTPTCEGLATCIYDPQCNGGSSCEPTDHVVISEVLYNPSGDEPDGEWFELYNPTESAVDISLWTLDDNYYTITIPDGTSIGAGEFLSIANDGETYNSNHGCYPDLELPGLDLSNSGDFLILSGDDLENPVDFVAWGDAGWTLSASEGNSIVRDPAYCDTDTANDWLDDQTPSPVCGEVAEPPEPPGDFMISEGSVILSWTLSPSPDVVGYNLYFTDEWGNYDFGTPDVELDSDVTEYVVGEPYATTMPLFGVVIMAEGPTGLLSEPSKELGKDDIELTKVEGGSGKNTITMSLITEISSASDLMDAIGPCDAVNWWDPVEQEWKGWISFMGGFGTDFPVEAGEEYEVSVTETTTLTLLGEVPG
jgi:hypothetical protein